MKSVYTGGEKVAEFESYDELRVGDGKPAFIYEGNELVYPNLVKDGLVLWYDFSGRTNADGQRGIAEDLSGNGNHGTLQNFNFTPGSGYDKNELLFDGVDDSIVKLNLEEIPHKMNEISIGFTLSNANLISHNRNVFEISGSGSFTGIRLESNETSFNTLWTGQETNRVSGSFKHSLESVKTRLDIILSGELADVYINGVFQFNFQGMLTPESTYWNLNIFERGNSAQKFKGGLHSFSIYNRPLTPEEIAHNYAIEKGRFDIE